MDEDAVREELIDLLRYANKTAIATELGLKPQSVINWSRGKNTSLGRLEQVRALYGLSPTSTRKDAPPEWARRLAIRIRAMSYRLGVTDAELAQAEADLLAEEAVGGGGSGRRSPGTGGGSGATNA